jgi:hypothetical protein
MTVTGPQDRKDASQELARRLGVPRNPEAGEPKDTLSELEATIGKVENAEARKLLLAQARTLRSNFELEEKQTQEKIRRIENGARDGSRDVESKEDRELTKANITANALLLLEKGVPANVIGQYLINSQTSNIPINFGGGSGGQQQGLTMADVVQIFTLAKGEKGTAPELTAILNKLTDKVSELENKVAAASHQEPKKAWIIHPDGTKEEIQTGEPIVIRPLAVATGENIELLKEQNRHAEEVEKIKGEKDYKEKVANTLASLPEKIGAGLASSIADAEQPPAPARKTSDAIAYLKCESENCGYSIPYPKTATKIVCPKCRAIYERKNDEKKTTEGDQPQ